MKDKSIHIFLHGARDGVPIAAGYFAVAFSLGFVARKAGLDPWQGFVSSLFTRASAGEYGGYTLMAMRGGYIELILLTLVANLRYLLMSSALTQKFADDLPLWKRVLTGCCVTDEIFGISIAYPGMLRPAYTVGAAIVSGLCWASGTAVGIAAGNVLPDALTSALGVTLYGMFIAVFIPPARAERGVLWAVIAAFVLSGICAVTPVVRTMDGGTRTILLTLLIAAAAAVIKPIDDISSSEATPSDDERQ